MADTTHLVITLHGIRTYGDWQDELKKLLEAAEPGVTVRMYRFGVFSSLAFLIPPIRWLMGRQFRRFFEQEIRSAPEGARIDLVAHSFGTYLAASALRHLPEGRKIHSVIFAGSVLPPSFPWYKYLQSGAVGRVVNDCGWNDSVLVLCQSTALLMGMAGRIGFRGMVGANFVNRYYLGGHGLYFDAEQRFMREKWLPILTGEGPVQAYDERPRLTAIGGIKLFVLNNMHFIKVVGACLLLMMLIFIPLDLYRTAANDNRVESFNHIALLTNAQEISQRVPSHVTDLLKIDAKATDNERAFAHLSSAQSSDNGLGASALDEESEAQWWQWEWLTGMWNNDRVARTARAAHHRANRELVSGTDGLESRRAKAQADYETAVANYEKIKENASVTGSYALCLMDYGELLADKRAYEEAATKFKMAREDVFKPDIKTGKFTTRPDSLAVDSLVQEAQSLTQQKSPDWELARKRLIEAIHIAEEQNADALKCDAYNAMGWFCLERLEADAAARMFHKAKEAASQLVADPQLVGDTHLVYEVRLFWIRHGLALSDRLKGRSREAYDQFDQIVGDLQELMGRDLTHTPKQRRDLHERLINSMERRADVFLFARQAPELSTADGDLDQETIDDQVLAVTSAADIWKTEDDFQKAIKEVGNGDLVIKVRLLYKKVIARFLAEVESGWRPLAVASNNSHEVLEPIEIEFDEANSTLDALAADPKKELKTYHDIAEACVGIRRSAPRPRGSLSSAMSVEVTTYGQRAAKTRSHGLFDPKAVDRLRSLTVDSAARADGMAREKVEMVLLALEILLKKEIEPEASRRAPDANRLMAVLGATTKVAQHPELNSYFDRFKQIALRPSGITAEAVAARRSPPEYRETMMSVPASPEIVRFSLKLGSWLDMKVTTQRLAPQAVRPGSDGSPRPTEALSKVR